MQREVTLFDVAMAAGELTHASAKKRHNAKLAVEYIMSMPEMLLPSGGIIGGKYAFRYTSTGAGSLNSKELRESYFERVGWPLESFCTTCNKVQRNAIGHLFPRVFGGSWNKVNGHHHSAPECTKCNSDKGQEINPEDEKFLNKQPVSNIEGWQ